MTLSTILTAAIPGTGISAGAVVTAATLGLISGAATGAGMALVIYGALKALNKEEVEEPTEEKTETSETAKTTETKTAEVKDGKSKKSKKILDEAKDVTTEEVES